MINRRQSTFAMALSGLGIPFAVHARQLTLGFAQVGAESQWRIANSKSIQESAAEAGIALRFADAQGDQANQINAVRAFIAQRVDVIALAPVVTTGWDAVLSEARRARIPVILTDRSVETRDDGLYMTLLGSDFTEEGRRAGRWLLRSAKPQGEVRVVELQGTAGAAPTIERKQGFGEVIRTAPRIKLVHSQTADFTRAKGKEVMASILKAKGRGIDVVYAHNDDMALGAIQALEEAGLRPAKDVLVIGIDAVKEAFEAMAAGRMNVTVECNPLIGPQLMNLVRLVADGKPVPKRVQTKEGVFAMETAAAEFPKRKY